MRSKARSRALAGAGLTCALLLSIPSLGGCTGRIDEGPLRATRSVGASRFPRLSHEQWENATRDLLHLDAAPGDSAPWDPETTSGIFQNVGAELGVTGSLWEDYRDAAERIALEVAGDPDAIARVVPRGVSAGDEAGFVRGFGLRAYRRPLTEAEERTYLAAFGAAAPQYPALGPFEAGVAQTIATMLQSPHFLYRVERSVTGDPFAERVALDGFEIATRLSFALWNSIPDDALLAAAASGALGTEDGVREEATRMLEDPRADVALLRFHHLLLATAGYSQITRENPDLFPEYTPQHRASMVGEVEAFVRDVVLERDLGLEELLTADYTFADVRIAGLYGEPGPSGDAFERIDLDGETRAGILTMPGFLASNATSLETDPIHRGVFVARRIVCAELPAPPNGVPPLPADDSRARSMRERIEAHTSTGVCGSCHARTINPLGYPFERFDALGRVQVVELRTGAAIDTASSYELDGSRVEYADAVELTSLLAASPQVHDCYARHLAEFLFAERPVRRTVVRRGGEVSLGGGGTRDVVLAIVTDELFRTRPNAPYDGPAPNAE
jgi:hypothetical protein